MVECVHAYRADDGEKRWTVDIDGEAIDFTRSDEALQAARMLAGPGQLLVIDRRTDAISHPGD